MTELEKALQKNRREIAIIVNQVMIKTGHEIDSLAKALEWKKERVEWMLLGNDCDMTIYEICQITALANAEPSFTIYQRAVKEEEND